MRGAVRQQVLELRNGRIRYFQAGDAGPPVILLHGGGLDTAWISWRHAIPALSPSYRVYAPDWPKHGGSRPWKAAATQEGLEACLIELLDAWQLPHVTLVGLSMGASAAVGVTLRRPERVDRLVLVDSGGLQQRARSHKLSYLLLHAPFLRRLASRLFARRSVLRYALQRQLFKGPVGDLHETAEEVYHELRARGTLFSDWQVDELTWDGLKTNHMPRLHEIACPTLIIHGSRDDLVPLSVAREAARRIPRARLHVMEGCGHWPNRERPDAFNKALLDFLGATDGELPRRTQ